MKVNTIVKNGSLYLFGNIFNKAIAFVTVPIFTRLLSAEEYGIVNTYTSWVNLLAVIVGISLGNSIRNAYVDMKEELGKYISSIYTLSIVNFGIVCSIVIIFLNHITLQNKLVWLCLAEAMGNFAINAILFKFIMEEEAKKRTILMVCPNLIGAIISIILISIMKENKYYGRIVSTCLVSVIFGLAIILYYLIKYKTFYNKKYWTYALPISLPLVLHGISVNVLGTSDRTIITYYCGASQTGIYSLIYNLSMVAGVITSSAESIWIPRMTRSLQKRNYQEFNYELNIYIYIVLFAFCGLLTIAHELVVFLGGEEYISGMKMVFPIVASSFLMFIYGIYVNIEYYYKKTRMIAVSTIVAAGLNVLLNYVFVPKYGTVAAAYTTLVSYFVSFLLHSIDAKRIDKEAAPYKMLIVPIVVIAIAGVITNMTDNYILIRWGIMCVLGILYIYYCAKILGRKRNETIDKE